MYYYKCICLFWKHSIGNPKINKYFCKKNLRTNHWIITWKIKYINIFLLNKRKQNHTKKRTSKRENLLWMPKISYNEIQDPIIWSREWKEKRKKINRPRVSLKNNKRNKNLQYQIKRLTRIEPWMARNSEWSSEAWNELV